MSHVIATSARSHARRPAQHAGDPPPPLAGHRARRRAAQRVLAALGLGVVAAALAVIPGHAEVPRGWEEAFTDEFSRTLSGSWGSAYTLTGSRSASGVGNTAYAALGHDKSITATVNDLEAADVDLSDTLTLSAAAQATFDVAHSWTVRIQPDGSAYHGRVRISSTGQLSLGISRTNATTSTWLDGVALPAMTPGTSLSGELQVTGTSPVSVRARAWTTGSAKPGWQLSYADDAADRISVAGRVAVRSYAERADSAVTVSVDDLSVGTSGTSIHPARSLPLPPVPPAPPVPRPARGSVPVGTASYPVPPNAVFVSPGGSDTNPGTLESPLRSARVAATLVPSGGAIVLRSGVYHESVKVVPGKTVTIQNYPGEPVWFDGSTVVSGWTKQGSYWLHRGWTTEYSNMMGHDAAFKARFIGTNPMAADPDQVFLDGVALRQVSSAPEVVEGTFYVSDAGNAIVIGSDPTDKQVRASDISQAIVTSGAGSVVRGIGVRRYANGYEKGGAVKMGGPGTITRDVVIHDVATMGLSVTNRDKLIERVTVRRAGQLGISGYHNDTSVVRHSIADDNNTEGFKDAPVAGGMKFSSSRTIRIENNQMSNNAGTGLWFDVSAYDMTVVNNTLDGNTKYGIEVEVSDTAIVANNRATGGEAGITVFDSGNVTISNNEVGGSTQAGIKLIQDERRQASLQEFSEARDPRYLGVVDPAVPWLTQNIRVLNNIFGSGGWYQLFSLDGKTDRAVDTWNLTVDGNLFNPRPTRADPTMVAWGKGDGASVERYETPDALASAKGPAWRNAQVVEPLALSELVGRRAAYADITVPVPADVAAATGLPAAARLLGVH